MAVPQPQEAGNTLEARVVFRNTVIVLATIAAAYVLVSSLQILVVLLIAIIIASAVRPIIHVLERMRIPFGVAVIAVYGAILALTILLFVLVIPPIINQLASYLSNEDRLAVRMNTTVNWLERTASNITGSEVVLMGETQPDDLDAAAGSIIDQVDQLTPSLVTNIGSTVGSAVLVFVMGAYWLTSRDKIADFFEKLLALKSRYKANEIFSDVERSVGSYLRGVISVALIIGTLNFLVLTVLGIPNAVTYGFLIGIMTMLPVVGGFIGGGGATLLAALTSPANGAIVFIVFAVIQQLENNWLTPRVMARSMKIDPLLVLIGIFMGFTLYGVIGGIIAVPVVGTLTILLRHLVIEPRKEQVANRVESGAVILNAGEPPEPEEKTPSGLIIGH